MALRIMPMSIQVYMAGIATCDITDEEIGKSDSNFKGKKIWEYPLAYFYRWNQWNFDKPMVFHDPLSNEEISSLQVLLTASDSTHGICDNEILSLFGQYIKRGVPIDYQGSNGFTALHEAIIFSKVEFVRLLIENGADINIKVNRKNKKSNGMGALEFTKLIRSQTSDPNLKEIEILISKKI